MENENEWTHGGSGNRRRSLEWQGSNEDAARSLGGSRVRQTRELASGGNGDGFHELPRW